MKMIAYRKSSKLKTFFAFLVSITFMLTWLPFLRSIMDGDSYVWGTVLFDFSFSGDGLGGDFWYLVLQVIFFGALFWSIYWVRERNYFYGLTLTWFILFIGNYLYQVFMMEDAMFHGDTLGVHVSLFWFVIPISIISAVLIFFMLREDASQEEVQIPWNRKNILALVLIMGPIPIQGVLLAIGEPHGFTDQIGVVISIAQSYLVPVFLRPRSLDPKLAHI